MIVDAPASWEVISNASPSLVPLMNESNAQAFRRWTFPAETVFSPYLFALFAGPFASWQQEYQQGASQHHKRRVPLRIFARKSLQAFLEPDVAEWFRITTAGLALFEDLFQTPYPFSKYDQIVAPDFNWGGMENFAASAFAEDYLFHEPATRLQRLERATVITHELCHSWFGNLVTMHWWDDLWLKEAFATLLASWANSQFPTQIYPDLSAQEVWRHFHAREKTGGYDAAAVSTAHPMLAAAEDIAMAEAHFDDLSYSKGASVLRQLMFRIGKERLSQALQAFFQRFTYRTATRSDFLAV